MANINKSFNFRNGLQVDDDNFIVDSLGRVGIGTTIPREILDVHGTAKITGLVTTTNLAVSGVSTFYSNVKVGSAITFYSSTGIVSATAFYGDGQYLLNVEQVAVDGWIVNAGTLSTASKVGIGTTFPYYSLQVGQDPLIGKGFSVDAITGNVNTTGILTGYSFSGFGTNITGINASNISNGTLNNSRLPSNLNISGIITANSGVVTSLTVGFASITNLYVSGFTTSLQGFVGNLVGIASTALSLSGTPNITVANINSTNINNTGVITSSNLHIGTNGVNFTALSSGKVGIGTTNPTSDLQIRKSGGSLLEVISDTSSARISIGQTVGAGKSTAVFRFGGSEKTLDIINNDTGNINLYLHAGPAGIGTGRFDWIYGQTNAELMSLTYEGKLGIGKTNPNETIHIVGTSTVTSNAYFGNHIYVKENIYFKSLKDGVVETNTNVTNGISTFSTLYLYGGSNVLGIATNNAGSYKFKIQDNSAAYLGNNVGIGTTNATDPVLTSETLFKVFGNSYLRSANIGTSISVGYGTVTANNLKINDTIESTNGFTSGIGTAVKIYVIGNEIYFSVGTASTSIRIY